MYKNDIKRGDSYHFGEYAMAPELDLTSWYNAILAKMKQIFQQIEDAGEGKKVNWIYGESFNDQPQSAILTYWDERINIPLTEDGSVICLGGTIDTESEEVILDGTSSLMKLSNNQLDSIENDEVRISTQQAEQLMKLIKQLSGYHLPHSGYIPVYDPLGELKDKLKELLISKGADIRGKTQLKMVIKQEWETTLGWISLIDSTNKKFGIVYWNIDQSGDSNYQTTLISASCYDKSKVDLQQMRATINGVSDENYWDNTSNTKEDAINKSKNIYGYDEVYIIDLINGESKLELPNCEGCEIEIELLSQQ